MYDISIANEFGTSCMMCEIVGAGPLLVDLYKPKDHTTA
jgi:hypothetical protein